MKPLKRKMQVVSFRSVEDCLEYLPEHERIITDHLRELIFLNIPQVREKLAYNVPYFSRRTNICFIWPGSILWGQKTNAGVRLGFVNGYLLSDESGYLDHGDRKQVYWRDFFSLHELDHELISTLLVEATDLDEQLWLEKQNRKS